MKTTIQKMLAILTLSLAHTWAFAGGFTPVSLQIIGMDVGDTGSLILRLSANTVCGGPLVYVGSNQPYYKDMLTLASVAYSTGKEVRVWIDSCDTEQRGVIVRLAVGPVWW